MLVDVDEELFESEDGKMLFYVGASRAKHNLDIVFTGNEEKLRHIVSAINDKNYPNSMIGIAISLGVKPVI